MEHLNNLKLANYVMAAFNGLALGIVGLAILAMTALTYSATGDTASVIGMVVGGAVGMLFGFAIVAMFAVAAGRVALGTGRILQSILAFLTIGSFPIGTLYAVYAIWVCWINEDSKRAFDAGGTIMLDP